MNKRRDRLQVIHDILKTISDKNGKIKPTHILYKSNLSHHMMDEYLKELIEKNFIKENKEKKGRTYSITNVGRRFIDEYKLVQRFTESFGLT
jgi:predicted transcriptional regulator